MPNFLVGARWKQRVARRNVLLSLGYCLFRLARDGRPGEQFGHPVTTGSTMILALRCS